MIVGVLKRSAAGNLLQSMELKVGESVEFVDVTGTVVATVKHEAEGIAFRAIDHPASAYRIKLR